MQEAGIKYKDPITSFGANAKYSGAMPASRVRGFDRMAALSGLSFNIIHSDTGEIFTNLNQTQSAPKGIWISRQGAVIKEDAAIPVTLDTNAGNSQPRIDFLVGKHYHDVVAPGGVAASYAIVKGPLNSNSEPNITSDPQQTVILGKFYIPANASSAAAITYIPNRAATIGGFIPALLEYDNRYTKQQQDNQASNITVITVDYEIINRGVILALDGGNTFKAEDGFNHLDLLPNKPNGTEINIQFIKPIVIRSFIENIVDPVNGNSTRAGYAAGMRPILISNDAAVQIQVKAQQTAKFVKVDVGGVYNNTAPNINYVWGECWRLVSVSDTIENVAAAQASIAGQAIQITNLNTAITTLTNLINNINPPRSLKWVDYVGNFASDFDSQGKGLSTSPYYGYHIANGNGGTPDLKGRMVVQYDPANSAFSNIGFVGGLQTVSLTGDQNGPHVHIQTIPQSAANVDNGSATRFGHTPLNTPTSSSGLGLPHENMPPYKVELALMWIGIP